MLEKPDLPDKKIVACLQSEYGLTVVRVAFLPLGADLNTAVYRAFSDDQKTYFVKLRRGVFDEISVELPQFLSEQGIGQIIAPLKTLSGQLWSQLDDYKLILYPFIEGHNGYEAELSDQHWVTFGTALKRIHAAKLPSELTNRIQKETYPAQWREIVKSHLNQIDVETFRDPIAIELAQYLKGKRAEILELVEHTERLAQALLVQSTEFVVCHSDIHAGNILMPDSQNLYIVDWDAPLLVPKERDLMYAGGGQFGNLRMPQEEETLFYRGYGQTDVNPTALAYYRHERIVEDIAVECDQILSKHGSRADREQALRYLKSNFLSGGVLDIAHASDKAQIPKRIEETPMVKEPEMTAKDVVEFVQLLGQHHLKVHIDGGWGVDALLGKQTRTHSDLDIALQHKDVPQVRALLEARGYQDVPRNDTRDCNFVLGDEEGHLVDFHSFTFDSDGKLIFGVPYPLESLTGTGSINGQPIHCISPEWMVKFHTGYPLDENDYKDVKALCQRFGVEMPSEYEEFQKNDLNT